MAYITVHFPVWLIVFTLFASETFIGIMPPDLYILWAGTLEMPYFMVLVLASSSYVGGIIARYIGTQLYHLPRVKEWVHIRFHEQFLTFKKYGGLLIIVSAMTPLPFSPVSLVAGVVKYPLRNYLLVAISRFVRFFLYAYIFYQLV